MKKTILNEQSLFAAPLAIDTGADLRPGIIAAANASRFEAHQPNEEATGYAVGFMEENDLLAILQSICPSVPVNKRFSFRKGVNSEYFLSEDDDVRAIGADFKRVEFSGDEVDSRLHNKGLVTVIDHDEEGDSEAVRNLKTRMLINRLLRNDLRRGIALLEGVKANENRTWNPAAANLVNPFAHLRSDIEASQVAMGMYPTRQVWGRTAWNHLQDLVEAHDGAIGKVDITPENVAAKLGLDRIVIVDPVYTTPSGKAKILGNGVFTYYAQDDADREDPSCVKRFVDQEIGNSVRVYVEEKAKFTTITVEHYSRLLAPSPIGIRKSTTAQA
jgi:hypothetical protein